MDPEQEIKELIGSSTDVFRDIKTNYLEFMSSLKYENMADKKMRKKVGVNSSVEERTN